MARSVYFLNGVRPTGLPYCDLGIAILRLAMSDAQKGRRRPRVWLVEGEGMTLVRMMAPAANPEVLRNQMLKALSRQEA